MKTANWSVNFEDPYYEEHAGKILPEAVEAVKNTASGCFVNLVTPHTLGNPEKQFIAELKNELDKREIPYRKVQYIDECGCGGHVVRVFR